MRFTNYGRERSEIERVSRLVAPNPWTVLIVGEADCAATGVAGRIVKNITERIGRNQVVKGDEFRSSVVSWCAVYVKIIFCV